MNASADLRSGRVDKLDILLSLRFSEEGREKSVRIPGLQRHMRIRGFCQLPLVRYIALPIYDYLTLRSKMKDHRRTTGLTLDRQDSIATYVNKNLLQPIRHTARQVDGALDLLAEQQRIIEALLERVGNLTRHLEASL